MGMNTIKEPVRPPKRGDNVWTAFGFAIRGELGEIVKLNEQDAKSYPFRGRAPQPRQFSADDSSERSHRFLLQRIPASAIRQQ